MMALLFNDGLPESEKVELPRIWQVEFKQGVNAHNPSSKDVFLPSQLSMAAVLQQQLQKRDQKKKKNNNKTNFCFRNLFA